VESGYAIETAKVLQKLTAKLFFHEKHKKHENRWLLNSITYIKYTVRVFRAFRGKLNTFTSCIAITQLTKSVRIITPSASKSIAKRRLLCTSHLNSDFIPYA
jgi:hypothetical protein